LAVVLSVLDRASFNSRPARLKSLPIAFQPVSKIETQANDAPRDCALIFVVCDLQRRVDPSLTPLCRFKIKVKPPLASGLGHKGYFACWQTSLS